MNWSLGSEEVGNIAQIALTTVPPTGPISARMALASFFGNKMSDNHRRGGRRDTEQRADDRFQTMLPVDVDGSAGWTRDVSATGVYFEAESAKEVGSIVNLMLELTISGEKLNLVCEGKVVRIDRSATGKVGVAARFRTSFFADGDVPAGLEIHTVPSALED